MEKDEAVNSLLSGGAKPRKERKISKEFTKTSMLFLLRGPRLLIQFGYQTKWMGI